VAAKNLDSWLLHLSPLLSPTRDQASRGNQSCIKSQLFPTICFSSSSSPPQFNHPPRFSWSFHCSSNHCTFASTFPNATLREIPFARNQAATMIPKSLIVSFLALQGPGMSPSSSTKDVVLSDVTVASQQVITIAGGRSTHALADNDKTANVSNSTSTILVPSSQHPTSTYFKPPTPYVLRVPIPPLSSRVTALAPLFLCFLSHSLCVFVGVRVLTLE
jgi:hypothetical protein